MISIIIPVFNVEEYIGRCVESVLNQTYQDFEILLIDDGSTDKSGEICDEYVSKDSRIKVFHVENNGAATARNVGIDNAKGEYISFIDSDDFVAPQMYEILINNLIQYKSDISACNYIRGKNFDKSDLEVKNVIKVFDSEQMSKKFSSQLTILDSPCAKLFVRKLFEDIRFPDRTLHEDVWVAHHLLCGANKVVYIDKKLYCYYERDNSISVTQDKKKRIEDLINGMIDRNLYFKNKHFYDVQLDVARRTANLVIFFYRDCAKDIRKKEIRNNLRNKFKEIMTINKNVFSVKQIRYHAFRINPWLGILLTDIMNKS